MRGSWRAVAMVLSGLAAAGTAVAQEAESGPTVEASIGTAVQDRALQGAAESFPASVGTVYCYTKIGKTHSGDSVEHVWYHGDQEVGRVKLNIGASPWRTWSSKVVPPEATGDWRVDVVREGKVLKSVSFKVE